MYSRLTNWLFQKYGIREVVWYEDMPSGNFVYDFWINEHAIKIMVRPYDLVTGLDFNEIAKSIEAQLNVL